MGDTFNFIYIWLILSDNNYDVRRKAYNTSMKETFKKISTMITEQLSKEQKVQKLMIEIGGGRYMEEITKGLPILRRQKPSKNHRRRRAK